MSDDPQTGGARQPGRHRPLGGMLEPSPRFADSFGLVLLLLIVGYFLMAAAGESHYGRIASLVAFAAATWLALRASQVKRRILRIALALIPLATLVAIVMVLAGNENNAKLVTATITGLLVIIGPFAILKRLVTHPVISLNTFYGAVCVYLLIAMFFASTYAVIALVSGQPFFAQTSTPNQVDYLYFSFITITTVGYGDLTAAASLGRMTAAIEAILGQLYLITVVALVVQNLGHESKFGRRMEEEMDAQDAASSDGNAAAPSENDEDGGAQD